MKTILILIFSFFSISSPTCTCAYSSYGDAFSWNSKKPGIPPSIAALHFKEWGINSSIVKIYPNPTQGDISIELDLEKATDVDITIYNAIGTIVYLSKENGAQGTPFKVDVKFADQPSGVYFVHVKAGTLKSVERLIKIK